jgi:hypothetical protein
LCCGLGFFRIITIHKNESVSHIAEIKTFGSPEKGNSKSPDIVIFIFEGFT